MNWDLVIWLLLLHIVGYKAKNGTLKDSSKCVVQVWGTIPELLTSTYVTYFQS